VQGRTTHIATVNRLCFYNSTYITVSLEQTGRTNGISMDNWEYKTVDIVLMEKHPTH